MVSIAIFNSKGGVGKTTLLCNLASYLALRKNLSVLIIDAAPQHNATIHMLPERMVARLYDQDDRATIYHMIHPTEAKVGLSRTITPYQPNDFGVALIPGDPRLTLTEYPLDAAWHQALAGDAGALQTTFIFAELLAALQQYDMIFFDTGPSLSAVNRAVLLACDLFVVPISLDVYSLRGIEHIGNTLERWRTELCEALRLKGGPYGVEMEKAGWNLQFAGYVTQQYTAKRLGQHQERRPVAAYENIAKRVPDLIREDLISRFVRRDGPARLRSDDFYLGTIPTFYSLVPMSQLVQKPIFELSGKDGILGIYTAKIREYEEIMEEICNRLMFNIKSVQHQDLIPH